MKKRLILVILAFLGGYLLRHNTAPPSWFTPDTLIRKATGLENKTPDTEFTTKVIYRNGEFAPNSVTIAKGNYLQIVNDSDDALMWLESNHPKLRTPRGYALSEQIKARMDEAGDFTVSNKLNLTAGLRISVSE